MTDPEAVREILAGRKDLFAVLVDRHKDFVYSVIRSHFAHCAEEAEDAAQEVFLKAFRGLGGYRGDASFATWLYRITLNHLADLHRRRKPAIPLEEIDPKHPGVAAAGDPEEIALARERRLALRRSLAELPESYRRVIYLYHCAGLSYAEIGRRLKLSERSVETRLYRAKKMLRAKLEVLEGCAAR